jgi:hypothetical protein
MKLRRSLRHPLALASLLCGLPAVLASPRAAFAQDQGDTAPPPPPEDPDASEPPPAEALPPAQPPDQAQFDQSLTPYGHWIDTPDYGRVWVPSAASNPDWQPYTDGSWVYTDAGWAFSSDVPWGWAAFHYGRWGWAADTGWYWVPGYTWAPAWVSWRYTNGHVAWAPYGPRGYSYGAHWHGWVAVPAQHFTHPIAGEMLPRAHAAAIIRGAQVAPSIQSAPERGRAYGPPRGVAGPARAAPHARTGHH